MNHICTILIMSCSMAFTPFNLHGINPKELYKALNIDIKKGDQWIEKLNEWGALAQPKKNLTISHSAKLPLFKEYPGLAQIPYLDLCTLPTPVQKLPNVISIPDVNLYIKLDGLSASPYGGNKTRKFAFEAAKALEHGAKTFLTFGSVGSNHAVAVSANVAKVRMSGLKNLHCICMLKPEHNSSLVRKNLLLHCLYGTELHYYLDNDSRKIGTIEKWLDHYNTHGDYPYIIPTGGSTVLGVIAYVDAAFELAQQIKEGLAPEPDYIYVACGNTVSAATATGLLLGAKAAGLHSKIMAIAIEPEEEPDQAVDRITKLFHETNEYLHSIDASFPIFGLQPEDINLNFNFTGADYGLFTHECVRARHLLQRSADIELEGVYTAKAFAALSHDVQTGTVKGNILFWNTYNAHPCDADIANIDYKQLPVCFHRYFEEGVQELDI